MSQPKSLIVSQVRSQTGLGLGGIAAAVRECPGQGAGPGLIEMPSRRLLSLMVPAAQRVQAALARPAALVVGDPVIQVTAG
jgi:hypothetical protein